MAGPTWPNRMYALSGTSYGATQTGIFTIELFYLVPKHLLN
jgi:hypothetical protein